MARTRQLDDATPMARALRTATAISAIEERIETGFDRIDDAIIAMARGITELTTATHKQDVVLSSLLESRVLLRMVIKYGAGIIAAIIAAIVVQFLTRK